MHFENAKSDRIFVRIFQRFSARARVCVFVRAREEDRLSIEKLAESAGVELHSMSNETEEGVQVIDFRPALCGTLYVKSETTMRFRRRLRSSCRTAYAKHLACLSSHTRLGKSLSAALGGNHVLRNSFIFCLSATVAFGCTARHQTLLSAKF